MCCIRVKVCTCNVVSGMMEIIIGNHASSGPEGCRQQCATARFQRG